MSATRPLPLIRADLPAESAGTVARNPRRLPATKLECRVHVDFAGFPSEVATPEGPVLAAAGDAIVTDGCGDTWPVPRALFPDRYRPVAPTVAGAAGTYVSVRRDVLALQMDEAFQVLLPDGLSRLTGRHGDWLVEGGDGSLYVVSAAAFARTYRIGG